jgi:hypothetical protein
LDDAPSTTAGLRGLISDLNERKSMRLNQVSGRRFQGRAPENPHDENVAAGGRVANEKRMLGPPTLPIGTENQGVDGWEKP